MNTTEITEIKPWKEKIKDFFVDVKNLFKDVAVEATQKIEWISGSELFENIKNFTIVAIISIICLFIIDNIIIWLLKLIF
jgi:preprotein translocase subunit SecE